MLFLLEYCEIVDTTIKRNFYWRYRVLKLTLKAGFFRLINIEYECEKL